MKCSARGRDAKRGAQERFQECLIGVEKSRHQRKLVELQKFQAVHRGWTYPGIAHSR